MFFVMFYAYIIDMLIDLLIGLVSQSTHVMIRVSRRVEFGSGSGGNNFVRMAQADRTLKNVIKNETYKNLGYMAQM
jgi:hypothetical protein